jgi:hypothetical protein
MTTTWPPDDGHTREAIAVLTAAARAERDFAGWLAPVLATVAAGVGSADALLVGRPGSWEAADVRHLVEGTVGPDPADLAAWRRTVRAPVPDGQQHD